MNNEGDVVDAVDLGHVWLDMESRTHGYGVACPFHFSTANLVLHDMATAALVGDVGHKGVESHVRPKAEMGAIVLEILHVALGAQKVALGPIVPEVGECCKLLR